MTWIPKYRKKVLFGRDAEGGYLLDNPIVF